MLMLRATISMCNAYQSITLLHFSLQLAVQSDHHLIVFSICVARALASSSSLCRNAWNNFQLNLTTNVKKF